LTAAPSAAPAAAAITNTPVTNILGPAQSLAAAIPRLALAAERLAFAAIPGPHARRRTGAGDQFWQYRDWQTGDETRRIDWRRSARGDRVLIRERERDAQSLVNLTLHDTPGLDFSSTRQHPTKRERLLLLLLATACLLTRAGAHVALTGITPPRGGAAGLDQLALGLAQGGQAAIAPSARRIEFGDFLAPDPVFDGAPGGAVIQILDPAECDFPYRGRIRFTGPHGEPPIEASDAAAWGVAYRARLAAQKHAVIAAARQTGQTPLFHRTDTAPAAALQALANVLTMTSTASGARPAKT
jgi:uncharacterized protein (DUF58 family)